MLVHPAQPVCCGLPGYPHVPWLTDVAVGIVGVVWVGGVGTCTVDGLTELFTSGACDVLLSSTCCCRSLFSCFRVSMVSSCAAIQALARCSSDSLWSSSFSLLFSLFVFVASCLALALSSASLGGA